ncbi:Asp-tRNA(Asn)/Glu-tRNA(Gln) amidotransferase subunit GatB [Chloroflexota bacterium]
MNFETIIGLEIHVQLLTKSKMFCRCGADYAGAPPDTHVCPICLGMPGVLPVINRQAMKYTIMTALALNCTVSEYTKFDRKNYPYPDLMKGYQISQYDAPIGHHGWSTVDVNGVKKRVGITRVHLEEDVAKLFHRTAPGGESYSLVDVNRSGVPLMEIVGDPDLRSPEEARQYLIKLHSILQYLGVSTANMEEGSFRCDANISIRPEGSSESTAKVEVKNMNSFRAVYRAMEYEAERQEKAVMEGKQLVQETRGWIEEKGETVSQRSKEHAHDYRYFPEPDLPPLSINREWVEEINSQIPELPEARRDRFIAEYNLSFYDANLLTISKVMADYFEACMTRPPQNLSPKKHAKPVANWIIGEFSHLLNVANTDIKDMENKVSPGALFDLVQLISKGVISGIRAKLVFEEMFQTAKDATEIIEQRGLSQISDTQKIEGIAGQVLTENKPAVADYKAGKEQALKFLVGQVMKATRGRANPKLAGEILKKKLEEV